MTERKGPDRLSVALFALAAFALLFAFLTLELSSAAPRAPRMVLLRRVYETTVIERVPANARARASVTQSSSSPYTTASAPATGSSR